MKNKLMPEKLYRQVIENTVLSCVDILVIYQDKYLIVKRKEEPAKNDWWFPGSRVLHSEKMSDAAIRTCKSEVGLEVMPKRIIGVEETIFETGKYDKPTHSINVVYLVESYSNDVKLDNNHSEFKWLHVSKIPDYLPKYIKDFVETAFINI